MNISSFFSFFTKQPQQLTVPDTILVKKLKSLSSQSNLIVFKDVNIYHHTSTYLIPLMVIDGNRGLYIFETKEWTYDELKNATIEKAQNQETSRETLAFDNTQNIIRQKFNELTHSDGVPIFNYLLMENLNADEYEHLTDSFKELLPFEKIIFSDSTQSDIFKKLQKASVQRADLESVESVITTLFVQYGILTKNKTYPCNEEQCTFIDKKLQSIEYLNGLPRSGKSNLILLKSIVELFNELSKKIIIIKPTVLACDIFKKKLLDIIEHAIIEIDLTAIEILTPTELLNKHRAKLKQEPVNYITVDDKLMKKSFNVADLLICDDVDLYEIEFINYLKHIQAKSKLILVNADKSEEIHLTTSFTLPNKSINFYETIPHVKALQLISKILKNTDETILILSNTLTAQKLQDDLESFIKEDTFTLDSSSHLLNQEHHRILFCDYESVNEMEVNNIILMDLCFLSENLLEYALNLSDKSAHILYEEDCTEIKELRNKYGKSSKNNG